METNDLLMLAKLDIIYNHMILRDAHEAGLIPEDLWKEMLKTELSGMMEVYNGNETEGSMV